LGLRLHQKIAAAQVAPRHRAIHFPIIPIASFTPMTIDRFLAMRTLIIEHYGVSNAYSYKCETPYSAKVMWLVCKAAWTELEAPLQPDTVEHPKGQDPGAVTTSVVMFN
jgi:hypothetical protein